MVIDTSALVAILLDEPERHRFNQQIAADAVRLLSAATLVETAIVLTSRKGPGAQAELDLSVAKAALEIVPVRAEPAAIACDAYRLYGKGRHPAGLNFGDVFAYALATATGEPLLFKGQDGYPRGARGAVALSLTCAVVALGGPLVCSAAYDTWVHLNKCTETAID